MADTKDREKIIVRTSFIGIAANIMLAGFKAAVGIASNSIAVVLDAVNNLSDAFSSIITIIGTKLAGKKPDKKHPFGYGRLEYMSQLIVAAIVLYAGATALVESIKKIIKPEVPDYKPVSLVIIASAVVVKLLLGVYVKKKGQEVNSGSLIASGSDALSDAILSISVLVSAIVFLIFRISLEPYVGVVISLIIVKSGIELIKEAVDEILGQRADRELTIKIKKLIKSTESEVHGVYDLFMNNYGPDRYIASFHVEVRDDMTASEFDSLTRSISETVYKETGVIVSAVGLYSENADGTPGGKHRAKVRDMVVAHDGVMQMHGFYIDEEKKTMSFDVVIDFAVPDRNALYKSICTEVEEAYPDYSIRVNTDIDVSD